MVNNVFSWVPSCDSTSLLSGVMEQWEDVGRTLVLSTSPRRVRRSIATGTKPWSVCALGSRLALSTADCRLSRSEHRVSRRRHESHGSGPGRYQASRWLPRCSTAELSCTLPFVVPQAVSLIENRKNIHHVLHPGYCGLSNLTGKAHEDWVNHTCKSVSATPEGEVVLAASEFLGHC